jgi:Tol biopolymer transport system component
MGVRKAWNALLIGALSVAALALLAPAHAIYPTSENGRITFVRCDASQCDIWLMNGDGSGAVDLTNTPVDEFDPKFSPDGRQIVFRRDYALDQRDVMIMNSDGSGVVNLTNTPAPVRESRPTFTPDGRSIIFDRFDDVNSAEILRMNPDGSGQVNLTMTAGPTGEIAASVSPDGRRIAYRQCNQQCDIWVMNADGTGQTQLTNSPETDDTPGFSPDGRLITYNHPPPTLNRQTFVMGADGSNQTDLTNAPPPISHSDPAFSADGQWIGFERYEPPHDSIALIKPAGSGLRFLTDPGAPLNDTEPAWESIQRCGKRRATIVGDDGPDKIKGTKRADVIVADAGKDKVFGRGGNDLICLGAGKDRAVGGKGQDKCVGGPGRDRAASCEKGKV